MEALMFYVTVSRYGIVTIHVLETVAAWEGRSSSVEDAAAGLETLVHAVLTAVDSIPSLGVSISRQMVDGHQL
jgi:hypothetical protein